MPVALHQVQGGDELGPPQMLYEVVELRKGVTVKLQDLVELLEVIAKTGAAIWLWDHNDGAGPGTGGFFDNNITSG